MDETVLEERHERRESRREDEEADGERSRLREKVAAGLSVAATAVGLAPAVMKDEDKKDRVSRESRRRRSPDEDVDRRREPGLSERAPLPAEDKAQARARDASSRDGSKTSTESGDGPRREAETRPAAEGAASPPDSDDGRRAPRPQQSGAFNPHDATDLRQLKEELAALDGPSKASSAEQEDALDDEKRQGSPSSVSTRRRGSSESTRDRSRERELAAASTGTKQVRVVSPPREKAEEKPKVILKHPSARFPEESNPVREGVAPHRGQEAQGGARGCQVDQDQPKDCQPGGAQGRQRVL